MHAFGQMRCIQSQSLHSIRRPPLKEIQRQQKHLIRLTKQKEFNAALELLDHLATHGYISDTTPFAQLIKSLFSKNQISAAMSVYRNMIGHGLRPDTQTISIIATGLLHLETGSGIIESLSSIIASLLKVSDTTKPTLDDPQLCIDIIYYISHSRTLFTHVPKLIHHMHTFSMVWPRFQEHLRDAYALQILSAFNRGRSGDALEIFNQMMATGIHPDTRHFEIMMNRMERTGGIIPAADFFDRYLKYTTGHGSFRPDILIFNFMVKAYAKYGRMDQAEKIVTLMENNHIEPDRQTFEELLKGYCRTRDEIANYQPAESVSMTPAKQILERMLEYGLQPDLSLYNILLNGYSKRRQTDAMIQCYMGMLQKGILPDAQTSIHFVNGFSKGERTMRLSQYYDRFLGKETEVPLIMDEIHSLIADRLEVKSLGPKDSSDEKDGWNEDNSESNKLPPNLKESRIVLASNAPMPSLRKQIYTLMIEEYCNRGRSRHAIMLFRKMLKEGMRPTLKLYTTIMAANAKKGRFGRIRFLLKHMKKYKIWPDYYVYHILMNYHVNQAPQSVLDLYTEMRDAGMGDRPFIMRLVFEAYVNLGRFGMAEQVLRSFTIESPVKPLQETYYHLIRYLLNSPRLSQPSQGSLESFNLKDCSVQRGRLILEEKSIETEIKEVNEDQKDPKFIFEAPQERPSQMPSEFSIKLAHMLLQDMIHTGYKPTRRTYFHIIMGHMARRDMRGMLDLYRFMWTTRGIRPDLDFRTRMYSYLLTHETFEPFVEALDLFLMQDAPDTSDWRFFTHYLFLSCESVQGPGQSVIMVDQLFKMAQMLEHTLHKIPSFVFSEVLQFCGLVNGNASELERLWEWMLSQNAITDEHMVYHLQSLVKMGNSKDITLMCTNWMVENGIGMTRTGLDRICTTIMDLGLADDAARVEKYWTQEYPHLVQQDPPVIEFRKDDV